jgi:hypothetical protein
MPFHFLILFIVLTGVSTAIAATSYIGSPAIFLLFSITSNLLLYFGFRKNAIYFDTFIGIFLWLGFWFKTTVNVIFFDGQFTESVGSFSGTALEFDHALIVASIGFLALIIASIIREKFIFTYPEKEEETSSLFYFYKVHRNKILTVYILLFLTVAITNLYFSIYQRGGEIQPNIPSIVRGIYTWLLLFGLSSFAALLLKYEFSLERKPVFLVPILTLIEATTTNLSLLSRGVLLNTSALGFGLIHFLKTHTIKIKAKTLFLYIFILILLFLTSLPLVDKLRDKAQATSHSQAEYKSKIVDSSIQAIEQFDAVKSIQTTIYLVVNRSVGMEGLLAISSYPEKNLDLMKEALKERYIEHQSSFYDNLIESRYKNSTEIYQHTVSFPGFIAFFYYPGSMFLLFLALLLLGICSALIEFLAYKSSQNNQILAALIGQVIAYRFIHFGYVPSQSYLLFGTILLNLFLIYGMNKLLSLWYKKIENSKP